MESASQRPPIDLRAVLEGIALLLRGAERHVAEDLRNEFLDLPRGAAGRFFLEFAHCAYWPVPGTNKHVVGLEFRIPGSGTELLAALRAWKSRRQDVLPHEAQRWPIRFSESIATGPKSA